MKYAFTIDEATEKPIKSRVEFHARTEERAYRFVIRHILQDPGNEPIRHGTLERLEAFGWEKLMCWKHGPGWYFPSGVKGSPMIDNRRAPGA